MTRNRNQILLNAFRRALLTRAAFLSNPNAGTLGGYRDRRKALLRLCAKARRDAGRPDLRGCVRTAKEAQQRAAFGAKDARWAAHYGAACGWAHK